MLEAVRARALRFGTPNERLSEYDQLRVYLQLTHSGTAVVFDGGESAYYMGAADGRLVFAIVICDDVPHWLGEIFGVDAEEAQERAEFPGEGEAVYIIAPPAPGEVCDVVLALPDMSTVGGWDIETWWPQTEQELLPLLEEIG